MTISYPLAFPSVGISKSAFRFLPVVSEAVSQYTGAAQVYKHQGEWWEGEVTFRTMNHAQVGEVKAFLAALYGRYGTFLYGDPDYLAKGANGTLGGTPLVNGGSQTGNQLITDGWPNSTTPLKKGDYFQLGTGAASRLYMMTEDAVADGSGNATLNFVPRLRSSPSNNQAIITAQPKGVMRLSENPAEWSSDKSSLYTVTLAFREDLTI